MGNALNYWQSGHDENSLGEVGASYFISHGRQFLEVGTNWKYNKIFS